MPRLRRDFPVTEPGKNGIYTIDFSTQVPPGTTITSVLWELSLRSPGRVKPGFAADPMPWARFVNAPTNSGTGSSQRVVGLYDGNVYRIAATATMSNGEQVELWSLIECRAPR